MNELEELREMRTSAPGPTPAWLAAQRLRFTRDKSVRPAVPRLAWRAALVGGLAAAVAVGIGVAQSGLPIPVGGHAASAAETLERAARIVQDDRPSQRPRDDQWVYMQELSTTKGTYTPPPPQPQRRPRKVIRMTGHEYTIPNWCPATSPITSGGGSLTWVGFDGKGVATGTPGGTIHCDELSLGTKDDQRSPAQLWDLQESMPTDPDAALRRIDSELDIIYRDWVDPDVLRGDRRNNAAFWLIGSLLGTDGVTAQPEVQATLFRALAKIPGVRVESSVTDAAGRKGTMVYRDGSKGGSYWQGLIFDPETYVYLGDRVKLSGQTTDTARLVTRIVDKPGALK